jgi:hypothetical protein
MHATERKHFSSNAVRRPCVIHVVLGTRRMFPIPAIADVVLRNCNATEVPIFDHCASHREEPGRVTIVLSHIISICSSAISDSGRTRPPSTTSVLPVMYAASSEAKNDALTNTPASSSDDHRAPLDRSERVCPPAGPVLFLSVWRSVGVVMIV